MLKILSVALLAMCLGMADGRAAGAAAVRLSGSTSVANSVVLPLQSEIENAVGVRITVTPDSSGQGLADLFGGRADIAMISADLDELLGAMSKAVQAYKVDQGQLRSFPLGEARVIFIVNPNNPVRRLSVDQIKGIYAGKITNWKDVGGPAMPILVWAESKHGAMRTMLERDLLGGQDIENVVAEAADAPEVADMVARSENAIGFVSSTTPKGEWTGTVPVETDVHLVQHLSLVTKGEPSGDVARVVGVIEQLHE